MTDMDAQQFLQDYQQSRIVADVLGDAWLRVIGRTDRWQPLPQAAGQGRTRGYWSGPIGNHPGYVR